jgi:hypothetical protein
MFQRSTAIMRERNQSLNLMKCDKFVMSKYLMLKYVDIKYCT